MNAHGLLIAIDKLCPKLFASTAKAFASKYFDVTLAARWNIADRHGTYFDRFIPA